MGHMKDLDRRIRQGGDDAIAAVSELMPRWIPVCERLPEEDENVLACSGGEVGMSHRYVDGWYWDANGWNKSFTPTHWMPLPEPPEVKP